jgi:hypothetical protein
VVAREAGLRDLVEDGVVDARGAGDVAQVLGLLVLSQRLAVRLLRMVIVVVQLVAL